MANILYGKLGRAVSLDLKTASTSGGDVDVARALHRIAIARPSDTFWIVGRTTDGNPQELGYPANVRNLWDEEPLNTLPLSAGKIREKSEYTTPLWNAHENILRNADAMIMWLGQHGTTNRQGGLPTIKDRTKRTNPYDSSIIYCAYLLATVNRWRDVNPLAREEILLCPDPRNYLKCRDNRWPLRKPILAQYSQTRDVSHERYELPGSPADHGFSDHAEWFDEDPASGRWASTTDYVYSALELTALANPDRIRCDLNLPRHAFGIISNENRAYVANDRLSAMREWVLGWCPDVPLFGKWSDKSQAQLGRTIEPVPLLSMLNTMTQFRATFTMPASGSQWATAKPWEAFAVGTICFFHPKYDTQNHILRGIPEQVGQFLRVNTPEELQERVALLANNFEFYKKVAEIQREHFERRFAESRGGVGMILDRLEADCGTA